MEYFLASIQLQNGFYQKLVFAKDKESATKIVTEYANKQHGDQLKTVFVGETLKETVILT